MNAPRPLSVLTARPGLLISVLVTLAAFAVSLALKVEWSTRVIGAIDLGLVAYLVAAFRIMLRPTTPKDMAVRAERVDEGRLAVLVLSLTIALVAIAAVMVEIPHAKDEKGSLIGLLRLVFVGVTVILCWLYVHTSFALHYTHEFYGPDNDAAKDKGARRSEEHTSELQSH